MLESYGQSDDLYLNPSTGDSLPPHLMRGAEVKASESLPVAGLLKRSDQPGYWFVYPSLDMRRRLRITECDIVNFELLAAEESSFGKLGGTRVFLRKGAEISESRGGNTPSEDDFDLDIQFAPSGVRKPLDICEGTEDGTTCAAECQDETDDCGTEDCGTEGCHNPTDNTCKTDCGATCDQKTCATCNQHTCHTCNTNCNQQTCHTCNQNTCNTCAVENTCVTCATVCDQETCHTCAGRATCHTCETQCNQRTCHTCETCHACTHVTCGHQPGCIPV